MGRKDNKRKEISKLCAQYSEDWWKQKSLKIIQKVCSFLQNYLKNNTKVPVSIGIYRQLKHEVWIQPLQEWLLKNDRFRVAIINNNKKQELHYYWIVSNSKFQSNLNSNLPVDHLLDIVIVPVVGYYGEGFRLGRGAGWFDNFFKKHPEIFSIGVAAAEQEIQDDIFEPHDIPLNCIITA